MLELVERDTRTNPKTFTWDTVQWRIRGRELDPHLSDSLSDYSDSYFEIDDWFNPPTNHFDRLKRYKSQFARTWAGRTLTDCGWSREDGLDLLAHLGREKLNAARNREFQKAHLCPLDRLHNLEYAQLVYNRRAAFLTVDIDHGGEPGGSVNNLNPFVKQSLDTLASRGYCPNWLGINPVSGKAQAIWYIDPVYNDGDPNKPNRPLRLYKTLCKAANTLLRGDTAFSHRIMRNPLYTGNTPGAYRWNAYHGDIYKMRGLLMVIDEMTGTERYADPSLKPSKTGRELIDQAKHNREQAENWRKLAQELDGMSIEQLEANDPGLIQGVRLVYMNTGTVARNVTAFRHALKIAYRLRKHGQRLSDNAVIDAYRHAYTIAQDADTTGRAPEMPDARGLQTMARRVRAYVTHNSQNSREAASGFSLYQYTTPREKTVLSTFGKRGGKTSAARKWADRNSELAKASLAPLTQANQRRATERRANAFEIAGYYERQKAETGTYPTVSEGMSEFNVSRDTILRALKSAVITLPKGRRKSTN